MGPNNSPSWLANVQGNIWPGFNKDYQAFMLVSFPDRGSGQHWLRALAPEIASAKEVSAFKTAFRLVRQRLGGDEVRVLGVISATWANVALSWAGLQRLLGTADVEHFPASFKANVVPWSESQAGDSDVHGLVILAADRIGDLDAELQRHRELLRECGVREVRTYRGGTLPGNQRGHEHFGFKDLISQPILVGTAEAAQATDALTPAGEVILGEPDVAGNSAMSNPEWTRSGSFLAFVQLQQHVEAFWTAMQFEADRLGLGPQELAARLVGRWQDGRPVANPPPRLSHIGRAYPRWLPGNQAARRRILRRGIPYGPPLSIGERVDNRERGILFVTYQADIARQFEHVWTHWLNGPNFPGPGAGNEAIVGQSSTNPDSDSARAKAGLSDRDHRRTRLVAMSSAGQNEGIVNLRLAQFVTPRYGGYFFSPSLTFLPYLAGNSPSAPSLHM